jgi:hypothetical protein
LQFFSVPSVLYMAFISPFLKWRSINITLLQSDQNFNWKIGQLPTADMLFKDNPHTDP